MDNNLNDNKFLGKKTKPEKPILGDLKEKEKSEKGENETKINNENNDEPENGKIPYYCALCGHKVILSSVSFDSLPHRRVDDAIICVLKDNKIENLLVKDKKIVIRRGKNRYEIQYTFKCPNCSILVAYQAMDFEEDNQETKNKEIVLELLNKKDKKILIQI